MADPSRAEKVCLSSKESGMGCIGRRVSRIGFELEETPLEGCNDILPELALGVLLVLSSPWSG